MDREKLEETLAREGIEIASLWRRMAAHIIDDLLMSMVIIGMYWDRLDTSGDVEAALNAMASSWFVLYAVRILYHWLFVHYYGATIGKICCKIRVIEIELLDNPSLWRSLLRSLVRVLSEFLMYLPFFYILANSMRLGIHDEVAKTIVVNLETNHAQQ